MTDRPNMLERAGFRLFGLKVERTVKLSEQYTLFFTEDDLYLKDKTSGETAYRTMPRADARRLAREIAAEYGRGPGWRTLRPDQDTSE